MTPEASIRKRAVDAVTMLPIGIPAKAVPTGVATSGITHVTDSRLAARVGASSLTATYRFLERLGHIAGPMIVAQLFLIGGQGGPATREIAR